AGEATTAFIAENFDDQALAAAPLAITDAAIGAVLLFTRRRQQSLDASLAVTDDLLNWSSAHTIGTPFSMSDGNDAIDLTLTPTARNSYDVTSASGSRKVAVLAIDENDALVSVDGSRVQVIYHYRDNSADGHQLIISIDGCDRLIQDLNTVVQTSGKAGGAGAVCAPMHGQLLELFVSEGDAVTAGDKLAVLEAMKMQHELRAEIDGVVSEIAINVGAQTPADALIMTISPNS
ncbi:MAG: biotin/lipoyl-containing protein, partial [Pseudomonadota bacterium]